MTSDLGPGPRSTVRRLPEKARYDETTVFQVLDAAQFCHLAGVIDGRAVVLPTLHVREGHRLYLHGSASNALLRSVLASGEACISVAIYDGLRLARSGFESSIAYRSAVLFGRVSAVDDSEAGPILDRFVDATLPGRGVEVRPMSDRERRLTLLVAFDIEEASVKLSAGPTDDDVDDQEREIWSGVVPTRIVYCEPVPSTDGAMARGEIAVPESVRRLYRGGDGDLVQRLLEQINVIDPVDARERVSIAAMRDRLRWTTDPFDERHDPRHVTASAFVISPRGVILHRHRLLGIWVQPGGHVDSGESPETAVLREVLEETGLIVSHVDAPRIFHVDVHQGPRGHTHYDVRYVVVNSGEDPNPAPGESPDVEWFNFTEALSRCEPALRPALAKLAEFASHVLRATLEP